MLRLRTENEDVDPPSLNPWGVAGAAWATVLSLVTLFLTVFGIRHFNRIDKHDTRLGALEQHSVTKEEFHAAIETMRSERREMHKENLTQLEQIVEKLGAAERYAADSRHALKNDLNTIGIRVAVLADRMERK